MEESDEPRARAVASLAATENPNPEVGNNSSKAREEGELSSSDDDKLPATSASQFNASTAAQKEAVRVASLNKSTEGVKAGTFASTNYPKSSVNIPSRPPSQPHYQKGTEKNRAPFVPFVISFSDDDSGSDREEFMQSKTTQTRGNALRVVGNQRPPASSATKSQILRGTTRNEARVMPRKVSLSRTFVSSIPKTNGANSRNGGHSLGEERSRVRNFHSLNKGLADREHVGKHNVHLNSSKLQDLRQQIAIREKELKLKSAQQNKETTSNSSKDCNAVDSDNDAARKCRSTSAYLVPFEPREPDKKRLRLSESHLTQLIPDARQQRPSSQSASEKSVQENGGQQSINDRSGQDKEISLGTLHTGASDQKKQDDAQGPLSSRNQCPRLKDGADIFTSGNRYDRNTKLLDPSISSEQTRRASNGTVETFRNEPSTAELKHPIGLNFHHTQMLDNTTCGHNLTVGSDIHEVRSDENAFKLTLKDPHQASSLCVPDSNAESSDVSLNNATCNCLATASISRGDNIDMQSLIDIEELQEKELEEAQEHRRKCEIEERNALKAYRNAQRALIEANARCSYLYRKRELYSAHCRSLMMENSGLFSSSRLHNCSGAGLNSSNNMSEDNVHHLATSSPQMQPKFNDYNQRGNHSNIQNSNGQIVSDQHADGQDLASDPCSEPDASTSEPRKDAGVADGVCSPSSDLNASADEDEDTSPFDHKSVHRDLNCQSKNENHGERAEDINDEAKRKFSCDNSQDSLLLEATLRSQLFARLGTDTLSKKRGQTHNTELAAIVGAEHGGDGQADTSIVNVPFLEVDKNQHSALEGSDGAEKGISDLPVQVNDESHVENFSSNYASPTADLGCFFPMESNQSSRSVTFSCPILRSTFGHLKVAESIILVGLQSNNQQIHNYDIYTKEGNSVTSTEIQPRILGSNSMDNTLTNISAGKDGCYSCNLAIDPFWPLCMFELRGKCNDDECSSQHVRDYSCRNINLENSDCADCQVGSTTHRGKSYASKGLDLTPPTYLVCLDVLKADLHPHGSIIACRFGQCWQKCFSTSMVLSSLLPSDSSTDEPFLHGTEACIEVPGSWNSQSLYFHSRNSLMSQLDQCFADDDQTLERALLNLKQEINKQKGRIEALKVLAQALEVNPSSSFIWVVYLHVYYSTEKSIGKDDMFRHAVEYNEGSYELWLMCINSRIRLEDRLIAYDNALLALCRHASANDCNAVHTSACILDLFLQLVNCLCISGNVGKAIENICILFPSPKNLDEPHALSLADILPCLTLYDKCIFWLCCVYLIVYKKLPDAIVQQFEREKELSEIEWPSLHLTFDEKQQAVTLMEVAVDSLALYIDSGSLESETNLKAAHMFALNHIRCIAVLEGFACSKNLLDKYTKLYPSCLELILMSARMQEDGFGDLSFVGFEEALSSWPEEAPGVQCIWNRYAECALQSGRFDFVKELMNRWFYSGWQVQYSQFAVDCMDEGNSLGSLDLTSALDLDAWASNSSEIDVVFGLLNLSLHRFLQNDLIEARTAIDKALKTVSAEDYKHCVREHAMFLLANGSQSKEDAPTVGILNILKGYLVDTRAFPDSQPLPRKFIENIKKPRVRQLVSNIWSVVSSDFSLVNLVLEAWHGPSLLPQTFSEPKDLVDFVEAIMEILPSNYRLAMSVCKLLGSRSSSSDVASASVSFWASSLLVNALFQAVPVAAEYVWVEAAGILRNLTDIQSIPESFHRRALSVYPFSINLWKSYLDLSWDTGNRSSVIEAARERGIKLD